MQTDFSCVIIDDESDAIELLESRLSHLYNNIEIKGRYTTWEEALVALRGHEPDLVFIDISMPEKSGLDLLELLPGLGSELIFTTSYSEYALEAFKFSATGYVLKPIGDIELTKAVDKAYERIKNKRLAKQNVNPNKPTRGFKIGVPNNKGIDYVNIADIIYLEAVKKYTSIVTRESTFCSSYNLGKFKLMLEGYLFYQIHRSYIVNMEWVARYESTGIVIMSDKTELPVARNFREDFLGLFLNVTRLEIGTGFISADER